MEKHFSTITIPVIVLLLIVIQVNSNVFIYPFLAHEYYLNWYITVIAFLLTVYFLFKENTNSYPINYSHVIVGIWIVYLLAYLTLSKQREYYFATYMLTALLAGILIMLLLHYNLIRPFFLLISLSITALFVSITVNLQYFEIWSPDVHYYNVTGLANNPNITAMFIILTVQLQAAWIFDTGYGKA